MQKYSPPNNEQQTTRDISIDDCVVLKYFFFENANRNEIENTIDVVIFSTVERGKEYGGTFVTKKKNMDS